ncbi:MAG: S-layer homology domain-containing protein [Acidimicrobiia bacterium]
MRRRAWTLPALLISAWAAALLIPVQGSAQTEEESFAFLQAFDGGSTYRIMLTNGLGDKRRQVTAQQAVGRPSFSPDGTQLVFPGPLTDDSDGRYAIYAVGVDGTLLRRLTTPAIADFDPAWSPDGTRIAFSRDQQGDLHPDTCCSIGVMGADGSGATIMPGTVGGSFPSWAPDSAHLVYQRADGIWVTRLDGREARRLAGPGATQPAWSPDGSQVAYAQQLTTTQSRILVVPVGGGAATVWAEVSGRAESPVWAPDGQAIYFVRYDGDGYDGRTASEVWRASLGLAPSQVFGDTSRIYFLDHTLGFIDAVSNPFIDVPPGHLFETEIAWLASEGITKGCNPPINDRFCPDDQVTRAQMAAFLVRGLELTDDGGKNWFTDDNGSIFEADINRLAAAGITKGCNPPFNDRFCPEESVSRAQMASFLVRARGYTEGAGDDLFVDDDHSVHEADIDRLGTAGVTKGCNPPANDRYCPEDPVIRGQMAAFLYRALRDIR